MTSKTQIMRKKKPALFYFFRRVLGVFFFLLAYNSGFSQIYINGDVAIFGNENLKSENAIIYISKGTYVHNFTNSESTITKKTEKNTPKIFSDKNKKKTSKKNQFSEKKRAKPIIKHHYSSTEKRQVINSSHLQKIAFVGSFQDFHQKYFENTTSWNSENISCFFNLKIILKTLKERLQYFLADFKVRPPPLTINIYNLKC